MIPHILLTGAGFSYNWGGYLAKETFDYLLGVTEPDEQLRQLLWAHRANGWLFETTLAVLRKEYEEKPYGQVEQNYGNMLTAVKRMFGDMWLAFKQSSFDETFTDPRLGVTRFLSRFNAIFTLNQDTLLETHYLPVVGPKDFAKNSYQGPRNDGAYRPGLVHAHDKLTFGNADVLIDLFKVGEDYTTDPDRQPYFKLHGSIDIQDGRNMMLILGGDKESDIAKYPILQAYHEQFRYWLSLSNARLMVIGYSFADHHINKMIFDAIENRGLKMFIVGPNGARTIWEENKDINPGRIKNGIVGASSRPLRNTLSGKDMVELMKIERFFHDGRMATTYLNPAL